MTLAGVMEHGLEQAHRCAKSALSQMAELGITTSPNNFTVWLNYFVGANAELTQLFDNLLRNEFDKRHYLQICALFFGDAIGPQEAIPRASEPDDPLCLLKLEYSTL